MRTEGALDTILGTADKSVPAVTLAIPPDKFDIKELRRIVAFQLVSQLPGSVLGSEEFSDNVRRVERYFECGAFR